MSEEEVENFVEEEDIEETGEENTNSDGDMEGEENNSDEENVIDISKLIPPRKVFKNNTAAILQKLKEIEMKNLPWIENMTISLNVIDNAEVDPKDDFNRELAYYRQSLAAVKEAQIKFEALGVKYHRPDDYFAEMLKSDTHMAKVRKTLLEQKKRIEIVEERKRQRELKKFGKKVQVEKEQKRAKERREQLDSIKKWRQSAKSRDPSVQGQDFSVVLDDNEPDQKKNRNNNNNNDKSQSPAKQKNAPKKRKFGEMDNNKHVNRKRKAKDEKYGFGGPKKRIKVNTAESSSELKGYSKYRNKSVDKDLKHLLPRNRNKSKRGRR